MEKTITIEEFKEVMRKGMVENFKRHGGLTPMVFFLKDGQPNIMEIPTPFLSSPEGKYMLSQVIRNVCVQPNVIAAGIIIEAFGAVIDGDKEQADEVINGIKKVSELDSRKDIIVMVFSTPESEELIAYEVNENTKEVLGEFGRNDDGTANGGLSGLFSGFFNWNKN